LPPRALARILIDRGDPAEALALLARLPETEASRTLAAQARLLEAGVDVSAAAREDMEAKLDELLDRVRDDDAARQEFVDLLEAMGADDPRTNGVPAGVDGAPVLMAGRPPGRRRPTPTPRPPATDATAPLAPLLDLGGRRYDLTHRALVMGILNRTPTPSTTRGPPSSSTSSTGGPSSSLPTVRTSSTSAASRQGPGPR
jgi:hypothetical protein